MENNFVGVVLARVTGDPHPGRGLLRVCLKIGSEEVHVKVTRENFDRAFLGLGDDWDGLTVGDEVARSLIADTRLDDIGGGGVVGTANLRTRESFYVHEGTHKTALDGLTIQVARLLRSVVIWGINGLKPKPEGET